MNEKLRMLSISCLELILNQKIIALYNNILNVSGVFAARVCLASPLPSRCHSVRPGLGQHVLLVHSRAEERKHYSHHVLLMSWLFHSRFSDPGGVAQCSTRRRPTSG